jgi:tetratricopeptide (TPR) repeat protein
MSSAFAELAELEYRLGDWPAAHASALESLRASRRAGLDQEAMASLVRLACIEAGLGRSRDCRRHAAQALKQGRARGIPAIEVQAGEAVGFLELGLDRIDSAIDTLEGVAQLAAKHPDTCATATWTTDLAEAYLRRGDREAAEQTMARLTQGPGFVREPALERTAAMLADSSAYERLFQRALSWSEGAQQPFELARTQLCFGERLHQEGRLQEACERVRTALASFEALGARPWAKRAQRLIADWGRSASSMGSRSYPRTIRPSTTGATGEFAAMYSIVTSSRPSPGCSTSVPPVSAV